MNLTIYSELIAIEKLYYHLWQRITKNRKRGGAYHETVVIKKNYKCHLHGDDADSLCLFISSTGKISKGELFTIM